MVVVLDKLEGSNMVGEDVNGGKKKNGLVISFDAQSKNLISRIKRVPGWGEPIVQEKGTRKKSLVWWDKVVFKGGEIERGLSTTLHLGCEKKHWKN